MNSDCNSLCMNTFGRLSEEDGAKLVRSFHNIMCCDLNEITEGLTLAEFSLMLCIEYYRAEFNQNITIAEAAGRLRVSVPAISRLLKNLLARKLVIRMADEADRRSYRLILTEEGSNLFEANRKIGVEIFNRIMDKFTDEELQQYAQLHCKFSEAMMTEIDIIKKSHN